MRNNTIATVATRGRRHSGAASPRHGPPEHRQPGGRGRVDRLFRQLSEQFGRGEQLAHDRTECRTPVLIGPPQQFERVGAQVAAGVGHLDGGGQAPIRGDAEGEPIGPAPVIAFLFVPARCATLSIVSPASSTAAPAPPIPR
ncbi:hypothetical protein [Nocardia neocaledoniensis]|uniref:hypothetical protein n=1 Tax=Nocardia neocaledoniensis TaxID=236511 RepID=UPI00313E007D